MSVLTKWLRKHDELFHMQIMCQPNRSKSQERVSLENLDQVLQILDLIWPVKKKKMHFQ